MSSQRERGRKNDSEAFTQPCIDLRDNLAVETFVLCTREYMQHPNDIRNHTREYPTTGCGDFVALDYLNIRITSVFGIHFF
jgi:hypothetical protein